MEWGQWSRHILRDRFGGLAFGLLVVLGLVLLRTAWLSDDAYITFRTIDNLVHGHGLRWNVADRVQTFTHPLWLIVMATPVALFREIYLTSILLSITCSLTAVWWLVFRVVPRGAPQLVIVSLFILSNSFVDYCTSGLENPLTFLLLAIFLTVFFRNQSKGNSVFTLSVLGCLLTLNRLDLSLLVLPPLLYKVATSSRPVPWKSLALGWVPMALWGMFSVVYFGSFFPNTAYAKLGSGHDSFALLHRGFDYLHHSAIFDPLMALCLVGGLGAAFVKRAQRELSLAAGVITYVAYVVYVGGDFMLGRMLTAPFLVGAVLFVRSTNRFRPHLTVLAVGLTIISGVTLRPLSCVTDSDFGKDKSRSWGRHELSDERHIYYQGTGLMSSSRPGVEPSHPWVEQGRRFRRRGRGVEEASAVGMLGFYAGPEVHIVDRGALCDPLLARLPARFFPDWRVGHYWRVLPDGYLDEVLEERPHFDDPNIQELANLVNQVSRAPVMTTGRWRAVWRLMTGGHVHLIDRNAYRFPGIKSANLHSTPENAFCWSQDRAVDITGVGIEFSSQSLFSPDSIELVLTSQDWRAIEIGSAHWRREIDANSRQCAEAGGLFTCRLRLPRMVALREVSYVRIFPTIEIRPGVRSPRQTIKSVRIRDSACILK